MTRPIRGHVDELEGRFISGWAVSDANDSTCLVRVTTSDRREIGRGRASHPRDDLRGVVPERANIAFRITKVSPHVRRRAGWLVLLR